VTDNQQSEVVPRLLLAVAGARAVLQDVAVPKEIPEWLAALRDPILGDLRLSPCVAAPEHIPDVLKAFGEQHPPARRRIVVAIDEMAIKLWFARKHKAPKKFAVADADLKRLETAARNLLSLWSRGSPYYQALFTAMILMVPPKERRHHRSIERRNRRFDFNNIDPGPALAKLLPVIRALRSPDIYSRAFSQPRSSRKGLERSLLWEPLFDLMHDFRIENFGKHQRLIDTIRALHRACGIKAPEAVAVRQALKDWRKRER
jgi:hypothetical protein